MRGSYFSWLSHDDLYEPSRVQRLIGVLEKFGFDEGVVGYSDFDFVGPSGNTLQRSPLEGAFQK